MSERLKVREAREDDHRAIETLWGKVIRHAFEQESIKELLSAEDELAFKMGQLEAAFTSGGSRYFVAFYEGRLVGTIAHGKPPNRGILRHAGEALEDTMEIGSLYIDPDFQRMGFGRELLIYILRVLEDQDVRTVCFDSIIESSKRIWRRIFGEPRYMVRSEKHDFLHMIWVVDVQTSLERIRAYK